jgi:integrase
MAVTKRGGSWRIDHIDPSGKGIRRSFKLKKDADAKHGKRVSLIAEGRYLDVRKDCKTTFGELLQKYEENFQHQRSFKNWKKFCLDNFKEYFKSDTILANIRYEDVQTYRNRLMQKRTFKNTIRTDATVNREIACLHHLFTKAVEWEMIEQSPFDRGRPLLVKENNTRIRFLSEDEITLFLESCSPHLRDVVVCALYAGMRMGEILGLRWNQVKNGFIYLRNTMAYTSRQIPINDTLKDLFKRLRKTQKVGTDYVFTLSSKGKHRKEQSPVLIKPEIVTRINSVQASFASALRKSGIEHCAST